MAAFLVLKVRFLEELAAIAGPHRHPHLVELDGS
jgi:hypothetical protein